MISCKWKNNFVHKEFFFRLPNNGKLETINNESSYRTSETVLTASSYPAPQENTSAFCYKVTPTS